MEIAQQTRFETAQREVRSRDLTILLGYGAFTILLMIGIYWGSTSSGTTPGDFASMIVFHNALKMRASTRTTGSFFESFDSIDPKEIWGR
jgi:hypothetical protein